MHKLYLAMQKCFPNTIFLINNVSNTSAEKVGNAREKKGADIIITSGQPCATTFEGTIYFHCFPT
jgi:hypothetical protein